ncbi:unnamed protein product [Phaeothamnion confervicola]
MATARGAAFAVRGGRMSAPSAVSGRSGSSSAGKAVSTSLPFQSRSLVRPRPQSLAEAASCRPPPPAAPVVRPVGQQRGFAKNANWGTPGAQSEPAAPTTPEGATRPPTTAAPSAAAPPQAGPGASGRGAAASGSSSGAASSAGVAAGSAAGQGGQPGSASLPEHLSGMYTDLEQALMARMRTHNKGQFRVALLSTLLGVIWVMSVFGSQIRRFFGQQAGEVARETLRHESLQVQTQELATAVVNTLLDDETVLSAATTFLRQAAGDGETQAALLGLATHVLRHPDTLREVSALVKQVVRQLLADPDTLDQVVVMMVQAIADDRAKAAASQLVIELTQDEEVFNAVAQLGARLIEHELVQNALAEVLKNSSHVVLNDAVVLAHSKDFVADVVADDAVQRTGGTALWNSVGYALRSRAVKAVGVGLACASLALLGRSYGGR